MKQFLSFIALFLLSGCTTQADLPFDYTKGLTGVYSMTYMNWNGEVVVMPEPGFSGTIRMIRADLTHLKMIFSIKVQGLKETFNQTSDTQQLELKPDEGKSFSLYDGSEKIGTISPTAIAIKTTTETGAGIVDIKAVR